MDEQRGRTEEERAYYALNRKVYAVFAPFYDLVTLPVQRIRVEVANTLSGKCCARVLDVATGTGAQARALAEKAGDVVGIDISEAMLRIAQRKNKRSNVTFRRADAAELPFDKQTFDAACISFALHEMPQSVRERVVREMVRVTKPGGSLLIVDYALPKNKLASFLVYHIVKVYERDHYADFIRSDVKNLLRNAGADVLAQRPMLGGAVGIYRGLRRELPLSLIVLPRGFSPLRESRR